MANAADIAGERLNRPNGPPAQLDGDCPPKLGLGRVEACPTIVVQLLLNPVRQVQRRVGLAVLLEQAIGPSKDLGAEVRGVAGQGQHGM